MNSAISNQYQTSFEANLYKSGLKVSEKKFREVARIFAEKTKNKPDIPNITLVGKINNSDSDGRFYHTVEMMTDYYDFSVANIVTSFFKDYIFNVLSPKKIAGELINVYRRTDEFDPANVILTQIRKVKKSKAMEEFRSETLKAAGKDDMAKAHDFLAEQMEQKIQTLEKSYKKVAPKEIHPLWCV